jgi:hypothetical protein
MYHLSTQIQHTYRLLQEHKSRLWMSNSRFIEMVEKVHVSVPLMDVLHVPS